MKGATDLDIPNDNNKIEKIRNDFGLYRKQDLEKQIQEFKNKPLIDIREFKTNQTKMYQEVFIDTNI
jgi:hypothetical protein